MTSSRVIRLLMFHLMLLMMRNAIGQGTESLRFSGSSDSCNVINLNIGRGEEDEAQIMGSPGRQINMAEVMSAVLKALAATSCEELVEDHGISASGYYQMRTNETNFATYKYCDLEIRNATSCEELRSSIGDSMKTGYYRFREGNNFVHCSSQPGDCKDVTLRYAKVSLPLGGVFDIYSESWGREVEVTCDLRTDGGGWTVFQRRMDGSVDFHRNWVDYVNGFGNKDGEFWLGLETIYQLTKGGNYELRIDLTDFSENSVYAKYGTFFISSSDDNYRLTVGDYSGTVKDSLGRHNNSQFSTKDSDHDTWGSNCAEYYKGGWWFYHCHKGNLNGLYSKISGRGPTGVTWLDWTGNWDYLKFTEMKFRRK